MKDYIFSEQDIDGDTLEYIDKYFKKVIINTKLKYISKLIYPDKYGISFVNLDDCSGQLTDNDIHLISDCFVVENTAVPVYDDDLADALRSLKEIQRMIILRTVVFKTPMSQLAVDYGISVRMVKKHKHNALAKLKRSLKINEK